MAIFDRLSNEGRTLILITHEQHVAFHAERVIEVSDGQIVSDAPNTIVEPSK
jgi:predicted ABC-type transport system involved in lysophospholipase L1 biosynthesis ATPase subunit